MACLTENQLLDLANGLMEPAQARAADEHLDGCASCRAVLAALIEAERDDTAEPSAEVSQTEAVAEELGAREGTVLVSSALADDLPRGTQLDRYVLLKRLGAGGMGVVYAAYDPRLDRTIAVKVLRADVAAGMDEEARARMLREAQAMARLSHPNVVTVHDAGTYEGRLYLAIEYLDEGTLSDWLAREPRSWREILEVFTQAGRGLAAAHAHGLVHRDFKPQNVMVAGDGRVRITDFGLVRPSGQAVRPNELTRPFMELPLVGGGRPGDRLTRVGALIGTPRYMAPEQLAGKDVDARADQFSFCVALYEAVYGTFPFEFGSAQELRRAIEEGRFRRPAPGRGAPEWLRRALVRGLGAGPEDRFPSMEALLDALQGGLRGDRRRAVLGWAAAGLAVAVAVGAAAVLQRSRACAGAPQPLAQVWTPERREAARAAFERSRVPFAGQAFQRAAGGLDAYASSWSAAQGEACAATRQRGEQPESVMAARMACLDRRLLELDALARLLASADAQVVRESAQAVSSLRPPWPCLNAAGAGESDAPSPAAAAAPALMRVRQGLAEARGLLSSGKYAEAEDRAKAASAEAREAGDRLAQAEAEGLRGEAQLRGGRLLEAEATLLRAEILAEEVHREDLAAELSTLLSQTYLRQTRREDAQLWVAHGEAALRRMAGGDDVVEAALLEQKARLVGAAGGWRDAVPSLKKVVELKQRALGPSHPKVAEAMLTLAREMKGADQLDEALAIARGAKQMLEKVYPVDHPETARAWAVLGQIHRDRGEYVEELSYAGRMLALQLQLAAPGSLEVASARSNLAIALDNLGQHERALEETREALAAFEAFYADRKDRHAGVASLVLGVGFEKYELGEDREALAAFQRSLPIHERALGADNPKMVHPLNGMGLALSALGRTAEADGYFQRARDAALRLSKENDDLFYVYLGEGRALYERGRPAESRERLERALEMKQRTAPEGSTVLAVVEAELARAELADGQVEAAVARADGAVKVLRRVLGQDSRLLVMPLTVAGEARGRLGDAAGALPLLEDAVALCDEHRYRPLQEAEARLALATVLRELRREPARAQALTAAAREQLAQVRAAPRPVGAPRPER